MDYLAQLSRKWNELMPGLNTRSMLSVGRVLRSAVFITDGTEQIVGQAGLSRAEFEILAVIRASARPLRASELARMTQASGAAITKRLDKLTRMELVERKQLPRDRRVVLVALTPEGEEIIDQLVPEVLEYEREWLESFTEQELDDLERLIKKLMIVVEPPRT